MCEAVTAAAPCGSAAANPAAPPRSQARAVVAVATAMACECLFGEGATVWERNCVSVCAGRRVRGMETGIGV